MIYCFIISLKYLYHSPDRSRLSDPTSDQQQRVEAGIHVHRSPTEIKNLLILKMPDKVFIHKHTSASKVQKVKAVSVKPEVWKLFHDKYLSPPLSFQDTLYRPQNCQKLASLTLLLDSWP